MKKKQKKIKRLSFRSLNLKRRTRYDRLRAPRLIKKVKKWPKNLINEITNFLDAKAIVSLFRANKHFYKDINDIENTRQKIEIAKTELNEEAYNVLNNIACKQIKELLTSDEIKKAVTNDSKNINELLVINEFKNCDLGKDDTYITVAIAQRMFFDIWNNIWSANPNLYTNGNPSIQLLENFLSADEIKQKNKNLLKEKYIPYNDNIFIDCLKTYINGVMSGFDKCSKIKVMSEFIKFWLWQSTNLGAKKEKENNKENHGFAFLLLFAQMDFINMGSFFFDSTKCDFSITFKDFVESLIAKQLESFLLDNKYNFVVRFKSEILNNLDLVVQGIIKNQNLMRGKELINGKIKKLLKNLVPYPCFIDKLRVVLHKQTKNLQSSIEFFIDDEKNSSSLSLETLKLKLKSESLYDKHNSQNKQEVPKQEPKNDIFI